jgi:acyl-CoA synthetase (NDP forming)
VLVLEAIRDAPALRSVLADAAARDVPVLLLTAGASAASRSLVAAHSGALAAGDGAWQALASAYGVHRVSDLAELADTLELFSLARRPRRPPALAVEADAISAGDPGAQDSGTGQDVTAGGGACDDPAADDSRAAQDATVIGGGRDDLVDGGGSIHASGGLPAALTGAAREESAGRGIATVHDSGFERAHVADVAAAVGIPFAPLGEATRKRLAEVLDPGLEPGNPLDVWGTGRDPGALFTEALSALADDPAVGAVALAVDLVPEYDGDDSYRAALLAAAAKTGKPLTVLASIPAAIDQEAASGLRAAGIPVLESTRTGLLALSHLLARATSPEAGPPPHECATFTTDVGPAASAAVSGATSDPAGAAPGSARRSRWSAALAAAPLPAAGLFAMLRDYGIPAVAARSAATLDEALAAAAELGYPVALKTGAPGIAHKTDVGGVRLGVASPAGLTAAYAGLSARLGPRVTVTEMARPGQELILGMARDPALGPLIVVGAGGVFAELLAERSVALPPLTRDSAAAMLARLRVTETLSGLRGSAPADLDAVIGAIVSFSTLIADVGHHLAAFDLNPVICSPSGVLAVDALAVPRSA